MWHRERAARAQLRNRGGVLEVLPGYGLDMPMASACSGGPCGSSQEAAGRLSLHVVVSAFGSTPLGALVRELMRALPKERIEWKGFYVYNKGTPSTESIVELTIAAREAGVALQLALGMPNVGRAEHTCLHHIITHYESLADSTIFLKDTVVTHTHLGVSLRLLDFARSLRPDTEFWCARPIDLVGLNWQLDDYKSERCWRFNQCYANESFRTASVRPLGRWMGRLGITPVGPVGRLGGEVGMAGPTDATTPTARVCYSGFFGASRGSIRRSSRQLYAKLREELSGGDSLEAGHYVERSWPSLFKVAETSLGTQFVRVAVFTVACRGGGPWTASGPALPSEADRLVSQAHTHQPVGVWPGDVCSGTACSRGGASLLAGDLLEAPAPGPNPVTDFVVFSDADARTLESSGLGGRWRRTEVRREVCSAPTPQQAGLAPPGSFGYTAFLPAKSLASVRAADVLRAVTSRLSALGGPALVVLGTAAPEQPPTQPTAGSGSAPVGMDRVLTAKNLNLLTSIVAVVQRSGSGVADGFRERWLNHSVEAKATGPLGFGKERTALGAAMRAFEDAAVVVVVDEPYVKGTRARQAV